MTTKLRQLPVTIDADKIALGMLEMFDADELTVLRFGMLPAKKMELLEKTLREKFEGLGTHPRDAWPLSSIAETYGDDDRVSMVNGDIAEWNIRELVSEAMHQVTLALYHHGDLVV